MQRFLKTKAVAQPATGKELGLHDPAKETIEAGKKVVEMANASVVAGMKGNGAVVNRIILVSVPQGIVEYMNKSILKEFRNSRSSSWLNHIREE